MDEKQNLLDTKALIQIPALGDSVFDSYKGIPASQVFAELRRKKGIAS